MKHAVHAWWCPSAFQLYLQKFPWHCLHWVIDRKVGTSILAKMFTRLESSWLLRLVMTKKFSVCFSVAYCTGDDMEHTKWLYLSMQHSWNFSVPYSVYALSGQSLCGRPRPTFCACTVVNPNNNCYLLSCKAIYLITCCCIYWKKLFCYWQRLSDKFLTQGILSCDI
jgi:hypothetical protein